MPKALPMPMPRAILIATKKGISRKSSSFVSQRTLAPPTQQAIAIIPNRTGRTPQRPHRPARHRSGGRPAGGGGGRAIPYREGCWRPRLYGTLSKQVVQNHHQQEAREHPNGRLSLMALAVALGDYLVDDDIEHGAGGEGKAQGQQGPKHDNQRHPQQ